MEEGEWDDYSYRQSRGLLQRYGLLQRTGARWPGVSMHGLVQWRAKKYAEEQPWEKWHLMVVVAGCVQLSKDAEKPEYRRELVAHVPELNKGYLNGLGVRDGRKELVWSIISTVYYHEGWWKEAEELFVRVMETSSRVLGEEHPSTLTSTANLASTYRNQGRWKEAEELFVRVMETSSRVLGEEHPDTLTIMNNLAFTLKGQDRNNEAILLMEKRLLVAKRGFSPNYPNILSSSRTLDEWRRRDT